MPFAEGAQNTAAVEPSARAAREGGELVGHRGQRRHHHQDGTFPRCVLDDGERLAEASGEPTEVPPNFNTR